MALYSKPSPFGVPQQQSTQSVQNTQFFNTSFPSSTPPNIMSMSQPAFSTQFPSQNWQNDGFSATTPNQTPTTFNHSPTFSSPPIQQKPASSAFDDLFATATAHFSNVTPANNPQNNFANKVQTPTTTTTAAHQDLESLFM